MSARWGRLRTERWRRGWTDLVKKNLLALFPGDCTHLPGYYCSNKGPALQLLLRVGSVQWQQMGGQGKVQEAQQRMRTEVL
ncbi:hypothetical protein Nmel_015295 [Mimus melanotis]